MSLICRLSALTEIAPPDLIKAVPSPRLRRQVWLRTASGQRLAYATSWWEASHIDDYLQNRSLPIWENLSRIHAELYRDVRGIYYGHSRPPRTGV